MPKNLRGPIAALALSLAVLLLAFLLDQGSAESRDAALIAGSLALYALIPAAVIWLVVALARRMRRPD